MWSAERLKLDGSRLFAAFYARRFFRIYPLSITCILLVFFFAHRWFGYGPICHPDSQAELWTNLTLTQNIFTKQPGNFASMIVPLWSLPLEVQMYLVLPALFLLLRGRSMIWAFGIWLASFPLALAQPRLGTPYLVLLFAPCFLGGVIAWRLSRKYDTPRLPGWLWPVAIVGVSLIWMLASSRDVDYCRAAFGLILGISIPQFREIPWQFMRKASNIVAKYSYGIYLSHFSILLLVFRRLPHHGRLVHYSVLMFLSVAVPVALYHGIEAPGIRYGQRVVSWITRKPIANVKIASAVTEQSASGQATT